jgi:hypothetical protein
MAKTDPEFKKLDPGFGDKQSESATLLCSGRKNADLHYNLNLNQCTLPIDLLYMNKAL